MKKTLLATAVAAAALFAGASSASAATGTACYVNSTPCPSGDVVPTSTGLLFNDSATNLGFTGGAFVGACTGAEAEGELTTNTSGPTGLVYGGSLAATGCSGTYLGFIPTTFAVTLEQDSDFSSDAATDDGDLANLRVRVVAKDSGSNTLADCYFDGNIDGSYAGNVTSFTSQNVALDTGTGACPLTGTISAMVFNVTDTNSDPVYLVD